ncbi:unnamed protein product, partial [Ectocarpus sp. 12 AP-2014]
EKRLSQHFFSDANVIKRSSNHHVAQKRERKRIKLRKNLKPSTDVSKLAGDVMKKCKYVHASKRDELERVIQDMQHQVRTKTLIK